MKKYIKALSGAMSIALLAASVSVSGYSVSAQDTGSDTVLPWTKEYVVENFNSVYDVTDTSGPFSAYGGVTRADFEISDGQLKGTYDTGSGENNNGYVWTTSVSSPEEDDIGVKFDIDTTNAASELRFRVLLSVSGMGYLQPASGTVVYLVSDSGDVMTATVDNISTFEVPADFKGSAAIYFNALFEGNNDKLDNEKLFKQSQLTFQLRTFNVETDGTVIYFDDIAYISNTGLNYDGRLIHALSNFSTSNISAWRDGSGDPTYNTSTSITVSDTGVKASYPVLSGNRMVTELKLWEKGVMEATDKAFSVDIDASGFVTTSPKLQIRLNHLNGSENSLIADGAKIDLIADTGEVIRVKATDYGSSKGSYINIPIGFKGTVLVELSDLTSSYATSVYDYAKMTLCCNVIDTKEAGSIVYSNVCYYGEKTELPWNYSNTVHDFSSFTTNPTCSGGGSNVTFKTDENLDSTGGNLKVTYPKVSGNEMYWELKLGTGSILKETDKAFGVDIDASSLTYSPKLQLQLRQENGSYYRTAADATVYFVADGTVTTATAEAYSTKGGYVKVPVGFKGTVVCGLDTFTDTNAIDDSDVYDITNMTIRALIVDATEESVITYDNIRYFGSAVGNTADLWFGADDANNTKTIDSTMDWLGSKLGVLAPSKCVATSSGYVYALDISSSISEAELISKCYMQGSEYNLVRKAVTVGEALELGDALIICGDNIYFGDTSPVRFGDCDSNKSIDIRDLIRLKKYLASFEDTDIYAKAAKMDFENEEIGSGDLVILRRYLIGTIDKLGY